MSSEEIAKLEWKDPEANVKSKLRTMMKEEGEQRFRCLLTDATGKDCGKLFKAVEFVEKHLVLKHPEVPALADAARAEAVYINAYVRDPSHISAMKDQPADARDGGRYEREGGREGVRRGGDRGRGDRDSGRFRSDITSRLGPRESIGYEAPPSMPAAR